MIYLLEHAFDCVPHYKKFMDYSFVKKMQSVDSDENEKQTWGKPLLFPNEGIDVLDSWQPIWNIIKPKIEDRLATKINDPEIAYINLFDHGDNSCIHTDREGYTAICYMNPYWNWNWGGETMFYEGDEVMHCQLPKGGDVVFFNGHHPHRAGLVSSNAQFPRMGLTYMFNEL